jgi:hypothetical protein
MNSNRLKFLVFILHSGATDALMSKAQKSAARRMWRMANNAKRFLTELNGNVDTWYGGRIDFDTFNARQRATWNAIREAGAESDEMVLRALRDQLPPARRAS